MTHYDTLSKDQRKKVKLLLVWKDGYAINDEDVLEEVKDWIKRAFDSPTGTYIIYYCNGTVLAAVRHELFKRFLEGKKHFKHDEVYAIIKGEVITFNKDYSCSNHPIDVYRDFLGGLIKMQVKYRKSLKKDKNV